MPSKNAHYRVVSFIFTLPLLLILAQTATCQESNNLLWEFRTYPILAKPLIDGGIIYINSIDGGVYALNESSGVQIWKSKIPGRCSNLVRVGEYLVSGCENKIIYGLSIVNGSRIWNVIPSAEIKSNPVASSDTVFLGDNKGFVYALDSDGQTRWKTKMPFAAQTTPLIDGERLYLLTADGSVHTLDTKSGKEIWNFTLPGGSMSTPTIYEDRLFIGSNWNTLYALDKNTGLHIWNYTSGGGIGGKPLVSREGIFYTGFDNAIYGVGLDGVLLWKHNLTSYQNKDMALYRGLIYMPSNDQISVINPENGSLERNFSTGGYANNPPDFSMGRMIISTSDGALRVFGDSTDIQVTQIRAGKYLPKDTPLAINVTVFNNGGLFVPNARASLYLDGTLNSTQNVSLSPYGYMTVRFNLSMGAGRHLVEASVNGPAHIVETETKNNRLSAVLWARDFWPIFRHDERRSGSPNVVDSFDKPSRRVDWSCFFQNGTYPNFYSPTFLGKIAGGKTQIRDISPSFSCRSYAEQFYNALVNITCHVSNTTGIAGDDEGLILSDLNFSARDFKKPANFRISWNCDISNKGSFPFSNVTLDWNCMKAWYATEAYALWNCNMESSSYYSLKDFALMKDADVIKARWRTVSPNDYGLLWTFDTSEHVYASAVAADLDASSDGNLEIVVASSDGQVYSLYSNGTVHWKRVFPFGIHASPALADLDNDGLFEVYIGDDGGLMHALGNTGVELWAFNATSPIQTSPLPMDFGATQGKGIVFGADSGKLHFLDSSGKQLWDYSAQGKIQSSVALGDVDGDKKKEAIFGSEDNNLYALSVPPYQYWMYLANDDITSTPAIYLPRANSWSSPTAEIVFGSISGVFTDLQYSVSAYEQQGRKCEGMDCSRGNIPVSKLYPRWAFVARKAIDSSPLVFDPFNNGSINLAFGSDDGNLFITDSSGKMLQRYSANKRIRSSASGITFDGEHMDVVFGDDDGRVFIISSNGTSTWNYATLGSIRSSPAVADINNDGVLETIVTSMDGSVYVFGYVKAAYQSMTLPEVRDTSTISSTIVTTSTIETTTWSTQSTSTTESSTTSTSISLTTTTTQASTTSSSTITSTLQELASTTTTSTTIIEPSTTVVSTTTSTVVVTSTSMESTSMPQVTIAVSSTHTQTTSTTTSLAQMTSTTITIKANDTSGCEPTFYTGVSAEPCVKGSALNNVVFIPSHDLDVRVIRVIGGVGINVTVSDSRLQKIAYTDDVDENGVLLNQTLRLKSNEIYLLGITRSTGCALKPPSQRTITLDGTWYVQDMWCQQGQECQMAVEFYPKECHPGNIDAVIKKSKAQDIAQVAVSNDSSSSFIFVALFVVVTAFLFGMGYSFGKKGSKGEIDLNLRVRNKTD